ncbi:MAG: sugar phosphate isomerase/epimerase family protein [Planctomycetota bacterium]
MDVKKQLAVQSYCFRNIKDNNKVADLVKEVGLDAIEVCGVHANFNDEATFDEVIGIYKAKKVRIVSIGAEGFGDDAAAAKKRFEFAKKAGCKMISCDFKVDKVPQAYRIVEKLAAEYGINLGIHNHGGRHWLGCAAMLAQVFAETKPCIGLCIDTAWALHSHENPVEMAGKFIDRLHGLHLKDFTFDRAGKHQDVVVGTGNLDLPAMFKLLKEKDFKGPMIIEYEGDVQNPGPSVKACVEAIMKVKV